MNGLIRGSFSQKRLASSRGRSSRIAAKASCTLLVASVSPELRASRSFSAKARLTARPSASSGTPRIWNGFRGGSSVGIGVPPGQRRELPREGLDALAIAGLQGLLGLLDPLREPAPPGLLEPRHLGAAQG